MSSHCYLTREVAYILDHCRPDGANLQLVNQMKQEVDLVEQGCPGYTVVAAKAQTDTQYNPNCGNSEITGWFCDLLRGVFHPAMHTIKEGTTCPVCEKIRRHIKEECHGIFVDGECVDFHKKHMVPKFGYHSAVPRVDVEPAGGNPFILAYYHPDGIRYRAFPYKEGLSAMLAPLCLVH